MRNRDIMGTMAMIDAMALTGAFPSATPTLGGSRTVGPSKETRLKRKLKKKARKQNKK